MMKTYYDYGTVTTLNDGDYIPIAPATPGTYKKILWSSIKLLMHPVGSYYVQYPAASSNDAATAFPSSETPAVLFGGDWELMYSTEGIVFQTEGYDGAGRTSGLMEDQIQGHIHQQQSTQATGSLYRILHGPERTDNEAPDGTYTLPPISDGTNGTPRTGTRTAHRNRLMRVYRRIA